MDFTFQPTPHEEAIALIKGKPPVTRQVFDQMLPEIRGRVFTITGVEGATVLQRIRDEISGIAEGTTWDVAKKNIADQLEESLGEEGAERRATLLLRTHGFQAFQASNWRVAQEDEDTTHLQYLATEDDHVRDSHLALNGVILPKDDPFWDKHMPPWEWGCRCRVRPMNPEFVQEARDMDQDRNPEDRLVIEGPALAQLRNGTLIRENRRYDVTPPSETNRDSGFRWHPDDLRIPLGELKLRYDPEVWSAFEQAAKNNFLKKDTTLWNWLLSKPVKNDAAAGSRIDEQTIRRSEENKARKELETPTEPSLAEKLKMEEDRLREPHLGEKGAAFDRNGNLISRRFGADHIVWTAAEADRMEHGVMTHSHPSNLPPSLFDYRFAVKHGVKEMRIVTQHGTWLVRPPEGGWPGTTMAERKAYWDKIAPEFQGLKGTDEDKSHELVVLFRQIAGADVRIH